MLLDELVVKIKRAETPLYRRLYQVGQSARRAELPAPRALYRSLYLLYDTVKAVRGRAEATLLFQPMLRAYCVSCGSGLDLYNGIPYLYGDLRLTIGNGCKINGQSAFAAGKMLDAPALTLGDHTNIGFGVVISVAKSVTLGSHVRIADGCYISDNPGHPLDPVRRRANAPVDLAQVRPVTIEDDVWLGTRVTVLPGVRIGRGSVIGTGSVVTRDVPPFSLAAGNPARVIRPLDAHEAKELAA